MADEKAFGDILGREASYYPIIRSRLTSINSKPINREKERKRKRDNLAREFNLTYRDFLLDDEQLLAGNSLFGEQTEELRQRGEVREVHQNTGHRDLRWCRTTAADQGHAPRRGHPGRHTGALA